MADLEQQIVDLRNELADLRRLLVLHDALPAHAFGTATLELPADKSTIYDKVAALLATNKPVAAVQVVDGKSCNA